MTGETEGPGEKPDPVPLCPPQILHGLTWTRTRAFAVRSRRLIVWAIWHGLQRHEKASWLHVTKTFLRRWLSLSYYRNSSRLIQDGSTLDVQIEVANCTFKQWYKFIKIWARKSLVFKLGPFSHAGIWCTKRLESITNGCTHIARLYVKLPTAQWWRMLLLRTEMYANRAWEVYQMALVTVTM
jgi:hypothetical protein